MTEKYVNKVIVILGASFAGMTCAQKLRQLNPNWDIVLIDKEIRLRLINSINRALGSTYFNSRSSAKSGALV